MAAPATLFDTAFDFPQATHATQLYAVCFAPRSGSNLLGRALWRTGCLGAPLEYFNYEGALFAHAAARGAATLSDYWGSIARARTSPNGVFGTKLLPGHWLMLRYSRVTRRDHWSHDMRLVFTYRRDIVAQAVSLTVAEQTDAWLSTMPERAEASYDYDHLEHMLSHLEEINRFWDSVRRHHRQPSLVFAYEDMLSAGGLDRMVTEVAACFGITIDPLATHPQIPAIERQAGTRNEEWRERFRQDLDARGRIVEGPKIQDGRG